MPCYLVIHGGDEDCGCGEYRTDGVCPGHPVARTWMCGENLKLELCGACNQECGGKRRADYACDFPVGKGKTCDLLLCAKCRANIGHERDLCPIHYAMWRQSVPEPHRLNEWPPREQRKEKG